MSQNHGVTKRNRRQISHTRGHEGRETQLALRSQAAQQLAYQQDTEVYNGVAQLATQAKLRREVRVAKRNAMRNS